MAVDQISFGGWANNLRIQNAHAEIIVTLEVGPRVISYRTRAGENVFKTFDEHLGGTGETEWVARGGHRFWLAPEDEVRSYLPDNGPVAHRVLSDHAVELSNEPTRELPVKKVLTVDLDPASARVTVAHRAENHGPRPVALATWGLSVMKPGGVEIIPWPALGEHPRDLLPNRTVILWPYTDMADPRWTWGRRFLTLRQSADHGPTKIGLAHREGWVAYHRGDGLFVKSFDHLDGAVYPDGGCNFETFTNAEMLEVEALGPLVELAPGEATEHRERWCVVEGAGALPHDEEALASWAALSAAVSLVTRE